VTSLLVGSLSVPAFAQPPQAPTGRDGESTPLPPAPPEEPPPEEPPPPGEEPPFEEPAPPPEIVVRGSERLVWDQPVAAYEELAGLTFRIYVDGGPRPLDGVSCARTVGPSGVECHVPLPRLSPGVHTLWVSAVSPAPERYESPYSWPIVVRLVDGDVGAAGPSARSAPPGPSPSSPPPSPLSVLTTGLDDPTDLAALPDGSLLIAERAGQIRWFREGEALRAVEVRMPELVTGDGRGLLSLAVDRDFTTTRAVFALYTTDTGLRAARFVFADGVLAQRAIVIDDLPAAAVRPQARLRMGPDRTLYLALDEGGAIDRAGDLGSLSGKVLRITRDGTTPADQPAGPPVHLAGVQAPTGLVWLGRPQTLWVTDNAGDARPQLLHGPADTAWPRAAQARFALPAEIGLTTAAAAVAAARPELGESLLVAGSAGRTGLLRITFGPAGDAVATAWIATDGIDGAILALASGADGVVYACTAHAVWRFDVTDP
jgi:Glucose / Sorbosone dehydrogenase